MTSDSQELSDQMRVTLGNLPYEAFVRCAADLLAHYGYTDVQPTGRKDRIGRNQHGGGSGYEIAMIVPGGALRRTAIAQVRQYAPDQPIYQRHVDELRGACLRVGATEGILLTLGPISPSIQKEKLPYSPLAPLRLIDGLELIDRMIQVGTGVRTTDAGVKALDNAYFHHLVREGSVRPRVRKASRVPQEQISLLPPHRRSSQLVIQLTLSPESRTSTREERRERKAAR